MRLIAFIISITILSVNAYAYTITSHGKITQLHFWQTHTGVLFIHENMINPDSCTRPDQYILKQDHPFFKELYSLFLAAHMADQPVRVGISGCHEGFPSIAHAYSNK